ncbi:MAG: M1 family peptidase [Candidatus Accumulibacter sp.]|uniref:M1 family metallopeptidase n=1 Tax=Accumulibacter sp. TaxID=2053492 RepID=UPI001E0FE697|nr:M1 family aminopeptidase [Accumulibacter sp.]MCB1943518.1 M1 family peptidase [Accumulibacter sp.]MCP5247221.1 M1 family peptidase [Accumulibacter sp.]
MSAGRLVALLLLAWLAPALPAAAAPGAPPPHLALDVDLDPASRHLQVVAVLRPGERRFAFALHESLGVTAAAADGRPLAIVAMGRQGDRRHWLLQLPAGSSTLRVEYQGTLPALDVGLDHRQVLRRLPPMAGVAGSFLPAGSAWYPQPAELFSYRVRLSVAGDQRALVAGRLVDEEIPAATGDRYRASFEFSHPADGIDLMAGPWIVREKMVARSGAEPLRLRTYFTRELERIAGLADSYLDESANHLVHYSQVIGPYPFSAFSVVASPLPTGFGMPTLTYLGAEVLKLPFIRATSLGHEILHNWWGNGVYVDYASGNWAEGLTTFMADYSYKEQESAAAARALRLAWLRDFAALPAASRQPLSAFRSRTHGAAAAVGYGKAAMVFVMLRDLVGEENFHSGLQTFWRQQRFRVAGWSDLQRAFEHASGRSLAVFFGQWLSRSGAPAPQVSRARAQANDAGGYRLEIEVTQSAPAYSLRLPIELVDGEGAESRVVEVDQLRQTVTLSSDRQPQSLLVDPELRLWRLLDANQLPPILRQWIVARAPRLLQASAGAEAREAAAELATRIFEVSPREISPDDLREGSTPVLLVGLHADVDTVLTAARLPARPENLARRGTAQVWTLAEQAGAPPLAVVSARDATALRALLRPLPHYGSQSWLVFDGSRALERGVWPLLEQAVAVSIPPASASPKKSGR